MDGTSQELSYSTVGVVKCVASGSNIGIEGLTFGETNYNPIIYKGIYNAADDEPAYWYRFTFFENDIVIQDTGLCLAKDEMSFELKNSLEYNKIYTVEFSITTVNGLEETISYNIVKTGELPSFFNGHLTATTNCEDGYIEIGLSGTPLTSNFKLYRSTDKITWDLLADNIEMRNTDDITSNAFKWRDYGVQQYSNYYYGLA